MRAEHEEHGFWWSAAGRALAWLTLRGRMWSLSVLGLVVVMFAARRVMARWDPAASAGVVAGWTEGAERQWWVSDERSGERVQARVRVEVETVQWWGRLVGARGRSMLDVVGARPSGMTEEELLRAVGWRRAVDELLGSSNASWKRRVSAGLRAASATGPARAFVVEPKWAAYGVGDMVMLWGMRLGLMWLAVALVAEGSRGSVVETIRARGLCWKCGYVRGGAERCPECGADAHDGGA